jgi:rSAM/selenodomain-associated transferase 2
VWGTNPRKSVTHATSSRREEQVRISVIIPVWNEEIALPALLARLHGVEIIVVDGGSTDRTTEVARSFGATVISSEPGRGRQLHAGALQASGDVLWFLHADSLPSPRAVSEIIRLLQNPSIPGGYFSLVFHGETRASRFLTSLYPKLRYLGLIYGDSGFFVRRNIYHQAGGFQPYPLFEDVEFARRIQPFGGLRKLDCVLVTSARRWEQTGFPRTFARWTLLQLGYWAGIPPRTLAEFYKPVRERASARSATA